MATIYDVAKAAGVSPKTVSRVLNSDGPVGQSTRKAVETAIMRLGYVRSNAARVMRSARSGLIGLVTGAISQDMSQPAGLPDLFIVQGIQARLAELGKTLMIADTAGQHDRIPALFRTFQEHRVEGLIYVANRHRKLTLPAVPADMPLMLANCFDDAGTPSVLPDDFAGQKALTHALLDAGHRRIAHVTLPEEMIASRLRRDGYRVALTEAGVPIDPALQRVGLRTTYAEDGTLLEDAIAALLELGDPPSVICFGNDKMAMRGYGILRSRGLNVPDDISVTGYDDYRAIAETLFPPLTTVDLAYRTIGVAAADQLLQRIDGTWTGADRTLIAGPLRWRHSVRDLT